MRRIVAIALILVLSLGIVQVASARTLYDKKVAPLVRPFGIGTLNFPFLGQDLIKYLNLTDDQINKIKELRSKYYEKLKGLYTKLQDAIFALRQLQFERQPDRTQIDKKRDEINNIRKEIRAVLNEYWKEFKGILTKEQLSKLVDRKFVPPFRARRIPWDHCPCPFFRW
ncbi:MAG: Spy/CpxP family protein refolding chaperone [bacterium]|nr:Spy/CpxP family protein refolding chaperone [bacterium]